MNQKNPNTKYFIAIGVMAVLIIAIVVVMLLPYITGNKTEEYKLPETSTTETQTGSGEVDKSDATKVEFTMTDGQKFTMEVYPHVAPITVENFLKLVNEGFYNGLTFHRVIDGFMAQGGAFDPVNQSNDPAESIKGEFASNGVENNLSHQRGVVSMARTNEPDSASSQFFICYADASFLDGEYAAFGYVTEGMETVDSFLSAGTDESDKPLKDVVIESAKVVE